MTSDNGKGAVASWGELFNARSGSDGSTIEPY